jgi:CheY-like chemotaxis protein
MLRELGCTWRYAANGREAVAAIEAGGLDLVLMDCQMPVMDGYEATRLVRSREAATGSPHIPIIALTAHAMKGDREVCLAAGMDDFLTKPLEPGELAAMITKWIAGRGEGDRARPPVTVDPPSPTGLTDRPGATPARTSVIDYEELLARVMGKRALADRLIGMFHQRVATDLAEIEAAITAGDPKAIEATAHRLKGSAANVSAGAIRAIAADLEAAGRERNLEGTAEKIERLRTAVQALLAELDGAGDGERRACA